MTLDEIVGQDAAVGALKHALDAGRLGHALILTGPAGVGKRTTALALTRALLCRTAPGRGCHECEECLRITTGSHPDVYVESLARAQQERPSAQWISIDQMRALSSQLALRPVRGDRKVAIVEPADRLTQDAQSALLKTLEEPPGHSTLLLIAVNAGALLPTVRSRCQRILFAPLAVDRVAAILAEEGIEEEMATRAAALSAGSLDRARELAQSDGWQRSVDLRRELDRLGSMAIPEVLDLAESLASTRGEGTRAQQALLHATLLDWARESAEVAAQAVAPGSSAEDGFAGPLAAARQAATRLERTYTAIRDLERAANARLTWDRLLLELRDL